VSSSSSSSMERVGPSHHARLALCSYEHDKAALSTGHGTLPPLLARSEAASLSPSSTRPDPGRIARCRLATTTYPRYYSLAWTTTLLCTTSRSAPSRPSPSRRPKLTSFPAHPSPPRPDTSRRPQNPPEPYLDLPHDVCQLVCDAALDLPPGIASSTLQALALVSRTWSTAAQHALYRNPWLSFDAPDRVAPRTFTRLEQLVATLAARPDLARGVLALDAGKYTVRCQTEAKVDRRLVSRLAVRLVAACPNLRALSLPFVVQADKPALLSALRRLALLEQLTLGDGVALADPWVVNVDVAVLDEWGVAQWWRRDLAALAPHWPRLRRVALHARIRGRHGDERIPWALDAFELALGRSARLEAQYVAAVLGRSVAAGTLRRLTLCEHQLEPGALVELLGAVGGGGSGEEGAAGATGLEELRTTTADKVTRHDDLAHDVARTCPHLRVLALETPLGDLLGALGALSSLRHLRRLALTSLVAPRERTGVARLVAALEAFPQLDEVRLASVGTGLSDDAVLERLTLDVDLRTVLDEWHARRRARAGAP